MTFVPLCMSPQELRLWAEQNARVPGVDRAPRPCDDCTVAFALSMGERCNGTPGGDSPEHQRRRRWWAQRQRSFRAARTAA